MKHLDFDDYIEFDDPPPAASLTRSGILTHAAQVLDDMDTDRGLLSRTWRRFLSWALNRQAEHIQRADREL